MSRQRSASPVKRSAASMEGTEEANTAAVITTDGHSLQSQQTDSAMAEVSSPAPPAGLQQSGDMASPPPYSPAVPSLSVDDQVEQIWQLVQQSPSEGQKGFVVSYKWLGRVLSRRCNATDVQGREFAKDASEGDIGPVDNSNIVAPGAFSSKTLTPFEDGQHPFVPLTPGLSVALECEILPEEAWNLVVSWYALAPGQLPIARFAHNTAPPASASTNVMYEMYPPVFSIRKMTPKGNRESSSPTLATADGEDKSHEAAAALLRVVASRTERFQTFLKRSKLAAGIPLKHKVRIWRLLETAKVSADSGNSSSSNKPEASQPGILTPATSRSTSPTAPASSSQPGPALIVASSTFAQWQVGIDYEGTKGKDETTNDKYNGSSTLDMLEFGTDQTLLFEEQMTGAGGGEYASDGSRAKKVASSAAKHKDSTDSSPRASPAPSIPATRGRTKRDGRPRGVVGLTNLGNTCYMNSALQCISRVEELAYYFLESRYKKDINSSNPLGYGGSMAKAYATFLEGIYSPAASSAYRPSHFKGALAAAQPMFSGYGQQDSQEFLSFLVDALHEDLNRVHQKPYIENPDSDDSTVHDPEVIRALGDTYQRNHRARNDSIAMDLFNGFYKNTMVCPDCDKVSVTFDPYSLLTLQLPIENNWQGTIYFVPHTGHPVAYEVDVDKNSTWKSVKTHVAAKIPGLSHDRILLAELYNHKIFKVFADTETVAESNASSNDVLCMYELPEAPTNAVAAPRRKNYSSRFSNTSDAPPRDMQSPLADRMAVPVYHCRGTSGMSPNFVLDPSFILVSREEAKNFDQILKKLLASAATLTSRDFLHEFGHDRPFSRAHSPPRSSETPVQGDDNAAIDSEGRITDHSVPSEDGYVDVAVQSGDDDDNDNDGIAPGTSDADDDIPPALRNLFKIMYLENPSGDMFYSGTGTPGYGLPMETRVQPRGFRRGSLESLQSTSSRRSQESGFSGATRSSSVSDEDAPDFVIGAQGTDFSGDVQSDDELPRPTIVTGKASRLSAKKRKGGKGNKRTYSKKDRRNSKQSSRSNTSRASTAQPTSESEAFYIKLSEGILLHWHEEAYDALFGAGPTGNELRGSYTFNLADVPIAEDLALRAKVNKRRLRAKNGITLEDCFAETGKTEILSEENAWYCNRCKELRRASKTLEIWTSPDILVVHLKRFSGERFRRDKVDVLVDFPLEGLDLTRRVGCKENGKEYLYDLFAVDNHYGGLGGGHYTAYAKNFFDGKWYDFNGTSSLSHDLSPFIMITMLISTADSSVSGHDGRSVISTAAYLLFYRRRSAQPLGPPELQDIVNKARNPGQSPSVDGSDAEDSSSGEGARLGNRSSASSRLLGHSSAGAVGAGAITGTRPREGAGDGRGSAANRAATLRDTSEDEGYQSGPLVANETSTWGFSGLQDVDTTAHSGEDTASDRPEVGSDYADSLGTRLLDGLNNSDQEELHDFGNNDDNNSMFCEADYADAQEHHHHHQDSTAMVRLGNNETDDGDADVNDEAVDITLGSDEA